MDILFENGTIRTLERNSPDAQALLVRNGRIAAVGGRTAVEDQTGIDVRRVDLAGRTLLPAFLDAHSHIVSWAMGKLQADLSGARDFHAIAAVMGDFTRRRGIAPGGGTVEITGDGLFVKGGLQYEPGIYESTIRYEDGCDFPVTLQDGEVFVLGDARDNATDSRVYGPVKADDALGKVIMIIRRREF